MDATFTVFPENKKIARLLLLVNTSITCISVTKHCVSFASENLRHLRMLDDLEKPGLNRRYKLFGFFEIETNPNKKKIILLSQETVNAK